MGPRLLPSRRASARRSGAKNRLNWHCYFLTSPKPPFGFVVLAYHRKLALGGCVASIGGGMPDTTRRQTVNLNFVNASPRLNEAARTEDVARACLPERERLPSNVSIRSDRAAKVSSFPSTHASGLRLVTPDRVIALLRQDPWQIVHGK